MRRFLLWLALSVGFAAAPPALPAQVIQGVYNPRDDQYRVLGLVRAQSEFERAETELDRAEQLYEREVISAQELGESRAEYERARVNYLQQSMAVIFAAPHVTIERALKSRTPDGASVVRLTLRNTTASGAEAAKLSELIEEDLLDQLNPEEINNVYVSLKAEPGLGGAIISRPYEQRIPVMRVGEPVNIGFRLLRDADEVVVSINYADKVEERTVYLEQDASANIVALQSVQFSQAADLGGQAIYDLQLERFTRDENVFRLAVVGLPREIRYEFRDPESGARLNQIRFPEGQSQKNLQLVLALPQRASEGLQTDEPISFWAMVLDEAASTELQRLRDEPDGNEALAELRAGKVRLEIVPRGVGRIEVRAVNLYHEITPEDSVVMEVTVRNTGSQPLTQVRLRVDAPLGWDARSDPEFIPELRVDGEREVGIVLSPPPDATVGDYEARIRTESAAADRRIETEDKTVRIHVGSGTNWLGTGALTLLLLGLVGGVVAFGVRLAKR